MTQDIYIYISEVEGKEALADPNQEIGFVSFVPAMRSCARGYGGGNFVAGVTRCDYSAPWSSGWSVQIFCRLQFADRCKVLRDMNAYACYVLGF